MNGLKWGKGLDKRCARERAKGDGKPASWRLPPYGNGGGQGGSG